VVSAFAAVAAAGPAAAFAAAARPGDAAAERLAAATHLRSAASFRAALALLESVQNIRMKLGCRSRADAARRATELGLVAPPPSG
jgi:hypothetical protein